VVDTLTRQLLLVSGVVDATHSLEPSASLFDRLTCSVIARRDVSYTTQTTGRQTQSAANEAPCDDCTFLHVRM
jgi:hypothetical protein